MCLVERSEEGRQFNCSKEQWCQYSFTDKDALKRQTSPTRTMISKGESIADVAHGEKQLKLSTNGKVKKEVTPSAVPSKVDEPTSFPVD